MQKIAITLDIDWAPDWCIELCADELIKKNCKATFFATHDSPILKYLESEPLFEVGIHPNFLPGSTQGDTYREVLDFCMNIVPTATSMRTHALVMSTPLLATIGDHYPQIKTDVSHLCFGQQGLKHDNVYYGAKKRKIIRIPFGWEDDVNAEHPCGNWTHPSLDELCDGYNIYNFHPILVALNIRSLERYNRLKTSLGKTRLQDASESMFDTDSSKLGCLHYFKHLCSLATNVESTSITEISNEICRFENE